jgi:hypothetical protein
MIHGLVREAREEMFKKLIIIKVNRDREADKKQVPPIY